MDVEPFFLWMGGRLGSDQISEGPAVSPGASAPGLQTARFFVCLALIGVEGAGRVNG
jgi:hypothetical protein